MSMDYNGSTPKKEKPSFSRGVIKLCPLKKMVVVKTVLWICLFLSNVCVWGGERAVHVITAQGPDRGQAGQTDAEKGTFTLNSTRLVDGAGSGIVAGPDRVRRGWKGETMEMGGVQGQGLPPGSWGAYPTGGQWGDGGLILADFCVVQMLNMQMSNRIVRR